MKAMFSKHSTVSLLILASVMAAAQTQQVNCTGVQAQVSVTVDNGCTPSANFGTKITKTESYKVNCTQDKWGAEVVTGPAKQTAGGPDMTETGQCGSFFVPDCKPKFREWKPFQGWWQLDGTSRAFYTAIGVTTPVCTDQTTDSATFACAATYGTCGPCGSGSGTTAAASGSCCAGAPPTCPPGQQPVCNSDGTWSCVQVCPPPEPTCPDSQPPECQADGTWVCPPPVSCSTPAPNDTCTCDPSTDTWTCECQGGVPTCPDGTDAVCYNGNWTCGTVSSCLGSPFTCWDGSESQCINNEWVCPPPPDPCDPIFSPPEGCDGAGASCDPGSWCEMCGYCGTSPGGGNSSNGGANVVTTMPAAATAPKTTSMPSTTSPTTTTIRK